MTYENLKLRSQLESLVDDYHKNNHLFFELCKKCFEELHLSQLEGENKALGDEYVARSEEAEKKIKDLCMDNISLIMEALECCAAGANFGSIKNMVNELYKLVNEEQE